MTDLYKTANGSALGESAQDMLVYGSKIYVGVTYSNRLAVLEKDGSLVKAIEPKDETGSPMNPRYMAAANGKVFAAYYSGHSVAVLDTASLEIEKVIPVGRYPEQLVVANNKLYVANSGGGDYPNYGNTVSVIDLNTLAVEKEIEVVLNPVNMVADSEGDVYLASMGNYNQASEGQEAINNTLQRIDGQTGEVTVMGNGTNWLSQTISCMLSMPTITIRTSRIRSMMRKRNRWFRKTLLPTVQKSLHLIRLM